MKLKMISAATIAFSISVPSLALALDSSTYIASQRGYSTTIPESRVSALCGDVDGCKVRLSMYNWDGNQRTASRETLFFYNRANGNWRDSSGDTQGTTRDDGTQHVEHAWACYFTDGEYYNLTDRGDNNSNFSVLRWTQYNYNGMQCRVTLID